MDEKDFKGFFRNRSTIWTLSLCMTGIIVLGGISAMDRTRRAGEERQTEELGEYAMLDKRARELNDTLEQSLDEDPFAEDEEGAREGAEQKSAEVSGREVIESDDREAAPDDAEEVCDQDEAYDDTAADAYGQETVSDGVTTDTALSDGVTTDAAVSDGVTAEAAVSDGVMPDAAVSDGVTAEGSGSMAASDNANGNISGQAVSDGITADASDQAAALENMTADTVQTVSSGTAANLISEQALLEAGIDFKADSDMLLWPSAGTILLDYSMDGSIYFPTLNQYKYNPAIVIGSEIGNQVIAAEKGIVESIYTDEETGTTLVLNIGNGYRLTYGQLKDLAVGEGSVIEQGALIGYIGTPTKYYTREGSNLYFAVTENGEPTDPMLFLG